MTIDEQLGELLTAWCEDIDSVPLPSMPRVQALLDQLEEAAA